MFPRRQRLSRALFPAVLKGGRRLSSPHFSVVVPPPGRFPKGKGGYAVVVPKKTVHLAADRHAIKRRVLAALRTLDLPGALVVFPSAAARGVSYEDLRTELAGLLRNLDNHSNKP